MKYEIKKNGALIGTIDTENKKTPIKFNKQLFPSWTDVEIIKVEKVKEPKPEVKDNGIK